MIFDFLQICVFQSPCEIIQLPSQDFKYHPTILLIKAKNIAMLINWKRVARFLLVQLRSKIKTN